MVLSNSLPISLVACTLGRSDHLDRLLGSITKQSDLNIQLVLVDQNCNDLIRAIVLKYKDDINIHYVRSAKGLSLGRNVGMRYCTGSIIGFPDDDCWYNDSVIKYVRRFFRDHPEITVLTGRTVDLTGKESVSNHLPTSRLISRDNVFNAGNSNTLFVRRENTNVIQFDETLGVGCGTAFLSGEETDFILKHLEKGLLAFYDHDFTVYHDQHSERLEPRIARVQAYSGGFGRVVRLHRLSIFSFGFSLVRAAGRAILLMTTGDLNSARYRYKWILGCLRAYCAPVNRPPRWPGDSSAPYTTSTDYASTLSTSYVFGFKFNNLNLKQVVDMIGDESALQGREAFLVVTANLAHIAELQRNSDFRRAYESAAFRTIDGMPVYIYARLRGAKLAERVTGSDLLSALLQYLKPKTHRVFFIASSAETGSRLKEFLIRRGFDPDKIRWVVPPLLFEKDEKYSSTLAKSIFELGTTHLFIGVGAPKSEIWAWRWKASLGPCYALCVGAGLEFFAGVQVRAPPWMRQTGLEWLWRFIHEPRRLFRRYFLDSWGFIDAVKTDLLGGRNDLLRRS